MINYMALLGVHIQMATVFGGSIRITREKDMEQPSGLMERDTRGNGRRVRGTGMEYTHGQVEQCIMENSNRATVMVTAVTGIHLVMNTTESTKMIRDMERESL